MSLLRGLIGDLIQDAHDLAQLQRVWNALDASERLMPEIAAQAARRLLTVSGDGALACAWLLPVWEAAFERPADLGVVQRVRLVRTLEDGRWPSDAMVRKILAQADKRRGWDHVEAVDKNGRHLFDLIP